MIHCSRLRHNLVGGLWHTSTAGRPRASCLYQQLHSPTRQLRAEVPKEPSSPSLLQPLGVGLPNSRFRHDSYADDFTLLASAPSIVETEARVNQLCSSHVRWADGKQLVIAPQKSSVTLFTSDTHQSRLHSQVRISPHAGVCVERASRAHSVMKALKKPLKAGLYLGFTTETLVATYNVIVRPMLNYDAPI